MIDHIDTSYNFIKKINSDQLTTELNTLCAQINVDENRDVSLLRIETVEDSLIIWFNQALSKNGILQLNDLIDNYVFMENYISEQEQLQINKLLSYLNNSDTTIASTARTAIFFNIAPRLGSDLIATINAQIEAELGI